MPSSGKASELFNSDLLAKVAPLACKEILSCASKKKPLPSALGSRIGTALHLIALDLEVMQPFQLPATAQDLSRQALQDFLKICKWPAKSAAIKAEDHEEFNDWLSSASPRGIYDELQILISSRPVMMRAGIKNFLAAKQGDVEFYANRFQELLNLLEPDNRKLDGVGQASLHGRHLKPHDEYVYPDDIRENLITALKEHATCVSSVHKSEAPLVEFDLIMAFMNFEFWQDFTLRVVLKLDERPKMLSGAVAAAGLPDDIDGEIPVEVGDVCRILEGQRKSRSGLKLLLELDQNCHLRKHRHAYTLPYVKPQGKGRSLAEVLDLGHYDLTPKVRIMLSFAVARSFWEFYGSELTNMRWSSEDIWFMPRWKDHTSSDNLELKAFVSFPFGQDPLGPDEFLEVDDLTHSYPRILSLGIILLEIGRGEKLGILPLAANRNLRELRDSVNDVHSDASCHLAALNNEVWEKCKYKKVFDTAISNCLDPSKFIESPSTRKRRSRLTPKEYEKRAVQDRRDAIYHNVVSPLYWLAKVGNDDGKDDLVIKPRKQRHTNVRRQSTFADDPDRAEIQELWKRVRTPNFNSTGQVEGSAERWFEDIRAISKLVFRQRRSVGKGIKLPPVRIALLDTGCDLTLKSFQAAKCFKGWRDFAVEPPSETEVDECGHGTFMARLVMQMVPGCELYIARIAQSRQQLEGNEERVAKAIRYAGREWEVDVISMSFGFPKFSQPISDAIHDVRKAREDAIIFLASAGNNVNRTEAYPACDPSVISMYATESTGTFLKTNPPPSEDSRRLLGTFGDNIPDAVLAELRARFLQGDFSAGTSVATAVAAGVVGLMLAYAALVPHVLSGCGAEGVYSDLKTTNGMRHMLFGMAKSWNALQHFINPILFWSYRSDDSSMYRGMSQKNYGSKDFKTMRTWFLPPDFTFAADGPLQLGTVIAHPKKPTLILTTLSSLNSSIKLPKTSILTETNHTHNKLHAQSNGVSIWTKFLGVASTSLNNDFGSSASLSYGAVDHEIRSFAEPLTAETALHIAALPVVQRHMVTGAYGKRSVYVVSGVRIAKTSFTVKKETGANYTVDLSGSGPPIPGPVPLELGASVAHYQEKTVTDSYETAPGIVFAYRVHVIRYKRAGVETELFQSKGAFMTGSGRADDEEPPIVVEGTKEELDEDLEEENDYTETWIGDNDLCISF
ncbi:hypothetical protein TruAng_011615 [Truncatella angustata]|nr:hypothetical protein TruAng_011615 [Truncatella angustata]